MMRCLRELCMCKKRVRLTDMHIKYAMKETCFIHSLTNCIIHIHSLTNYYSNSLLII